MVIKVECQIESIIGKEILTFLSIQQRKNCWLIYCYYLLKWENMA